MAAFLTNNGSLLLNGFEGDALHLAVGVLRMQAGEVQHIDFHTPLGVLSFLPASLLMSAGFGFGAAAAYSNLLVAVLFLPILVRVGETRFSGIQRYAFAFVILLLFLALARGSSGLSQVDMALYYNRWCWAVSGLAIALVLLEGPQNRTGRIVDGVCLGICFGFLALTKATFFVFLAPVVLIGLLALKRFALLAAALITGLVLLVLFLVLSGGTEMALAYFTDLKAVSSGSVRPVPSLGIGGVAIGPDKLASSLAVLAAGVGLRKAGFLAEGLFVLLLFPALVLISVQNWGNFGQWTFFLGLIFWALLAKGDRRKQANVVRMSALALAVVALPQVIGMSDSLLTHKLLQNKRFVTVFEDPRMTDLKFSRSRLIASQTRASVRYGYEDQYLGDLNPPDRGSFMGEELVNCAVKNGLPSYVKAIADDLSSREEVRGKQVLHASSVSAFWLFGGTERLTDGQLWYYGGDTGFAEADYLVVPFCVLGASGLKTRRAMLEEIEANDAHNFTEADRTDMFILYKRI
jgi:hypothetical protein